MGPADAVRTCLARYFDFRGRTSRPEFWWFMLFCFVAPLAATIADVILFRFTHIHLFNPVAVSDWGSTKDLGEITAYSYGTGLLASLTSLALIVPSLAAAARRLHDIGKSGWWQLLMLVPLIGFVVLLVWYCRRGEERDNAYGPPAGPV
jgi:uncharacterized membrane protein YhaH (DUF805 family)